MFLSGLDDYMIPCMNKKIFGVECLGCGMQRAVVLMFQGEFAAAFKMYPAIYPIFLLLAFILINFFIKFKYDNRLKMVLIAITAVVMVGSYIFKMEHFV